MYWEIGNSSFLVLTQKTRIEMTSGVHATPLLLNPLTPKDPIGVVPHRYRLNIALYIFIQQI